MYHNYIEYKSLDIENFSRLLPKNILAGKRWRIGYFSFLSSTLPHEGPAKKARPIKAESHNLYYHMNDLITEKNLNPVMTWTPGNMQCRHAPWRERHTNQDVILVSILPYLNFCIINQLG